MIIYSNVKEVYNLSNNCGGALDMENVFRYIEVHAIRCVSFLKDICTFEATAYDKGELDKMADYMP